MTSKTGNRKAIVLVAAAMLTAGSGIASAFDFGNMMNPSRWMGGNRGDDYYGDGSGGPGYGYGAPGYGYGAPGYGYAPRYGAPPYGAPGYGVAGSAPAYTAPAQSNAPSDTSAQEIKELKQRIQELEAANARSAPPAYGGGQSEYPPVSPGYGEEGGYVPPPSYSGQSPYQSSPSSYRSQPRYNPSNRSAPRR
jgi:hypothetical protein